jgi:hypothetical protein
MVPPIRALGVPLLAAALGLCAPPSADAGFLLVNGGFETGDLTGWSRADRPLGAGYSGAPSVVLDGRFLIDNADGRTPLSHAPLIGGPQSALGPSGGNFYAISDMTAQGTHSLFQAFTVPANTVSMILTFDMYVYDWSGSGGPVAPAGLDHATASPNQFARVDLLSASAGPFDTGGTVLRNLFLGVDPAAQAGLPPVYRSYSFDLTGLAQPGGTYQLRFAVTDNQFVLNQALDNVNLVATVVPEPSAWALLLSGMPLGILLRWRLRASLVPVPADPTR